MNRLQDILKTEELASVTAPKILPTALISGLYGEQPQSEILSHPDRAQLRELSDTLGGLHERLLAATNGLPYTRRELSDTASGRGIAVELFCDSNETVFRANVIIGGRFITSDDPAGQLSEYSFGQTQAAGMAARAPQMTKQIYATASANHFRDKNEQLAMLDTQSEHFTLTLESRRDLTGRTINSMLMASISPYGVDDTYALDLENGNVLAKGPGCPSHLRRNAGVKDVIFVQMLLRDGDSPMQLINDIVRLKELDSGESGGQAA